MCCEAALVDRHDFLFLLPETHVFIVVLKDDCEEQSCCKS